MGCAKAQVLRKLPGATPSERRRFYASEKQRHDVIKEKEEKVVVQDDKTEDEQESFCTPRPSIIRSSLLHNDSLRRPSLLGQMSQARGNLLSPKLDLVLLPIRSCQSSMEEVAEDLAAFFRIKLISVHLPTQLMTLRLILIQLERLMLPQSIQGSVKRLLDTLTQLE